MHKLNVALLAWMTVLLSFSPPIVAQDSPCQAETALALDDMLADAYLNIQLVDYDNALVILARAEAALSCIQERVAPVLLSRIFIYRGLALFFLEKPSEAQSAFLRALTIMPALKWLEDYGERPRGTFLDAKAIVVNTKMCDVNCPLLAPGVIVFVDGRELTQGISSELKYGTHHLQVQWRDGRWHGELIEVPAEKAWSLLLPEEAVMTPTAQQAPAPAAETGTTEDAQDPRPDSSHARSLFDSRSEGMSPVFVSTGVGLAAGGVAAIFGYRYWNTRTDLFNGAFYQDVSNSEKDRLLEENLTASLVSNASLAVVALSAASATFFYLRRPPPGTARKRSGMLLPFLTAGGAGLTLQLSR